MALATRVVWVTVRAFTEVVFDGAFVTGDASLVAGVVVLSVETGGGSTLTGDVEVVGSVGWVA